MISVPYDMVQTPHLVELEPGLYLGKASSHSKNIVFAKRYKHSEAAKKALGYAQKNGNWPDARIVEALTALNERVSEELPHD